MGAAHSMPVRPFDVPDLPGAVCLQVDPELFFPEKGGSTAEAKKVCRFCPVKAECLEWALTHEERFGVWGGLGPSQRKKELKKRQAAAREVAA